MTCWTSASFGQAAARAAARGCCAPWRRGAPARGAGPASPRPSGHRSVSVCPSTPCGWASATESDSPGQGRYSGAKTPSARRATGGRPVAAHDQTGLHESRQTSDHGRPSGAFSAIVGALLQRRLPRRLRLVAAEAHGHLAVLDDEVGPRGRLAGEERDAQGDRRADRRHAPHARLDGPGHAEAERARDLEPRRVAALGRAARPPGRRGGASGGSTARPGRRAAGRSRPSRAPRPARAAAARRTAA